MISFSRLGWAHFIAILLCSEARAGIVYVNHAASGGNNGSSWLNAATDLSAGLALAAPGDEVWVAAGMYSPAGSTPSRSDTFSVSGISVYGGFAGTEVSRDERSPSLHPTTLTGDLGGGLRAYHVLAIHNNLPQLTIVDGFTVLHGQADGPGLDAFGGGAILYANAGNGVVVANCRFLANVATTGGAMYVGHADADLVNCIFANNTAGTAGALYCPSNFNVIMHCTFYGNTSPSQGNALFVASGEGEFLLNIAWNNGLSPLLFVHPNQSPTVYRCCIESGQYGSIPSDPLFVNASGRDFRLSAGSPCIDAGWSALYSHLFLTPATDIAGRPRLLDDPATPELGPGLAPQPDLGAFEYLSDCNGDGIADLDDVAQGLGTDLNSDTVLDQCQRAGTAFCFGDGSGTPCPCGNQSPQGAEAGCANATGGAGRLEAYGNARLSHDSLVFHVSGLGGHAPGLYFQGDGLDLVGGMAGLPFGDGLRCTFGTIVRLGARTSEAGASSMGAGIEGDALISVRGQIPPAGGTRYYQVWYRSALNFCTPETFNASNAVEVQWVP